jgi:hypothetical protein
VTLHRPTPDRSARRDAAVVFCLVVRPLVALSSPRRTHGDA